MDPVARLALAHGGTYGSIAEGVLALAVAGLFLGIWLRERRRSRHGRRSPARMRE